MAIYRLTTIEEDVRIALDQNMSSDSLQILGDVDTLSLNDIIKSKVVEAVKRIHSEAPIYLMDGFKQFGDSIYWKDETSGWVLLPNDFMRLGVFEMDDWEHAVYTAKTADDPDSILQYSRFKGIRGSCQLPVCVVSARAEGRVLEFYSCKTNKAKISRAIYIEYPTIDSNEGVKICNRCYNAVVYMIAALTLSTYGDNEKSSLFLELSKTALI